MCLCKTIQIQCDILKYAYVFLYVFVLFFVLKSSSTQCKRKEISCHCLLYLDTVCWNILSASFYCKIKSSWITILSVEFRVRNILSGCYSLYIILKISLNDNLHTIPCEENNPLHLNWYRKEHMTNVYRCIMYLYIMHVYFFIHFKLPHGTLVHLQLRFVEAFVDLERCMGV